MAIDHRACGSFEAAMSVLAKPWTGLVFSALEDGPLRFGELREAIGTIGDRMLSLRLRELEERALVKRRVIAGPPVRVEYELTPVGRGFREVSDAMRKWGAAIVGARKDPKDASAKIVHPVAVPANRARRSS